MARNDPPPPPGHAPHPGCDWCFYTWGTRDGGNTWEWIPHRDSKCTVHLSADDL